jgi:hypothetical protein
MVSLNYTSHINTGVLADFISAGNYTIAHCSVSKMTAETVKYGLDKQNLIPGRGTENFTTMTMMGQLPFQ